MSKIKKVIIRKIDFKKLRKKAKITQTELAKLSGVARSRINQYENNRLVMSEDTWEQIVKVFNKRTKIK